MKRHVPPHLKKKFRRERRKLMAMSLGVLFCIVLGLSAVARKHYNKALPWHTAWLAHFGNGGWRVAVKSAIREGATYEEIEAKMGPPSFSEFSVAIGKTFMVYNRPGSESGMGGGREGAGLALYVDRENPVPLVPATVPVVPEPNSSGEWE